MKQLFIVTLLCVGLFPVFSQDSPGTTDANLPVEPAISSSIPEPEYPPPLIYVVYLTNCEIISSSTGMGGISGTIPTHRGDYYFSSTVGQSSAIGTFIDGTHTIRQGFQQPVNRAAAFRQPTETNIPFVIYPNPFQQAVTISFNKLPEDDLNISVFDNTGRMVINQQYPATPLIILPMGMLFDGVYIMRITIGDRSYRTQLIKQYR